jgi:hypothetical protein
MSDRTGSWMRTFTGKRFYPLDLRIDDFDILDIAHSLSMLCRYAGHCQQFYSVAQHSVLVANQLPDHLKLWGLLHDASEAYCVDVPRPLKVLLSDYMDIEDRVMRMIAKKFDLPGRMPAEVKRIDTAILNDESLLLLGVKPGEWQLEEPPLGIAIDPWSQEVAKETFLTMFDDLYAAA